MRKILYLSLSFLIYIPALAQSPDTLWTKTFGGPGDETPSCVQITNDNGYILLGTTQSFGNGQQDIYLIKTGSSGNVEWSKTYGGSSSDEGSYLLLTRDGNYLMMGHTNSFTPGGIWLLKINSIGDTIWTKHFGTNWDMGLYMIETSDGGYAIIGSNWNSGLGQNDLWMIKIDSSGNKLWEKIYGGVSYDNGSSVIQTPDDGYLALGSTKLTDISGWEIWLIRTNSDGDSLWTKKYGYGIGESIIGTSDGNYLITAYQSVYENSKIIKVDPEGNILWSKTFDIVLPIGNTIVNCPDEGFMITGRTRFINGQIDLAVSKIDKDGDSVWAKLLGGYGMQQGSSVCKTSISQYIILGSTDYSGSGGMDLWLILLDKEVASSIENYYVPPSLFTLSQNYPNPFNMSSVIKYSIPQSSQITIKIFNTPGEEIETLINEEKPAGTYELKWNAIDLPSGIYFYRIKATPVGRQAGDPSTSSGQVFIQTKKMILLK